MLEFVVHILDVLLYFLLGQAWLRRTGRGDALLNSLESGVGKWFRNRASANVREEVYALRSFLLWSVGILVLLFSVTIRFDLPEFNRSLQGLFVLAALAWTSLDWTFDHRNLLRTAREPLNLLVLVAAVFFTALITEHVLTTQFAEIARMLGVPTPSSGVIFMLLFALTVLALLLGYLSAWVFLGGISLFIVAGLHIASQLSKLLVQKVSRDIAWMLVFVLAVLVRLLKPYV